MSRTVTKFNGLNGAGEVSRADIRALIKEAIAEEQLDVADRLKALLKDYPAEKTFVITLARPAIEMVPKHLLECIDCEQNTGETTGLGKAVSAQEIYALITNRFLELIRNAKSGDWKMPWKDSNSVTGYLIPFNFVSKKRYRGVNVMMLAGFNVMQNPFFMTSQQIDDRGGNIRKGAHAYKVIYFSKLFRIGEHAGYDESAAVDFARENELPVDGIKSFPILRYYNVYNGADIEGINFKLDKFKTGFVQADQPTSEVELHQVSELILKHYPKPSPGFRTGTAKGGAYYAPRKDEVTLPPVKAFDTIQDYYATAFHEYAHSTGHVSRLKRDFTGKFGSKKYAFEELIAEFSATFLSAEAGFLWHRNKNHAAYIKNWNSALTHIEDDTQFIMRACTQAQKVADFILQPDEDHNPLYLKDLKELIKEKPKRKPVAKKSKPVQDHKPVGYALLDNITGELVASKENLKDLETVFYGLEYHKSFESLSPIVHEIDSINGKNKIGKKIDVSWNKKTRKEGDQLALFRPERQPSGRGKKVKPVAALNAPDATGGQATDQPSAAAELPEVLPQPMPAPIGGCAQKNKAVPQAPGNKNSLAQRKAKKAASTRRFYKIDDPDLAELLGQIEIKDKESVAITLGGEQGSGKSTMIFRAAQAFSPNYRVGHASAEEHPDSYLYEKKADLYWTAETQGKVDAPEISTMKDIEGLIERNDVIIIDSWSKLQEMDPTLGLDKDFRKKYDGKLFIIIYQLTTDGKMYGGAKNKFDGDVILMIKKHADFADNYAFADKNRYQVTSTPLPDIMYNIASGKIVKPGTGMEPEAQKTHELSFDIKPV